MEIRAFPGTVNPCGSKPAQFHSSISRQGQSANGIFPILALPVGTVYQNGSWADLKPGVHVVISGPSTVADTVAFSEGTGVAQSAHSATAINQRGLAKQAKGD